MRNIFLIIISVLIILFIMNFVKVQLSHIQSAKLSLVESIDSYQNNFINTFDLTDEYAKKVKELEDRFNRPKGSEEEINSLPWNKPIPMTAEEWETVNAYLLSVLPKSKRIDSQFVFTFSEVDIQQFLCLAMNIYYEARGSTLDDQYAVALVTVNRTNHASWAGSICDIVWEHKQFSWTLDLYKIRSRESWLISQVVAYGVMMGQVPDITLGATNYYQPDYADPKWGECATVVRKIGAHRYMSLAHTDTSLWPELLLDDARRRYATWLRENGSGPPVAVLPDREFVTSVQTQEEPGRTGK